MIRCGLNTIVLLSGLLFVGACSDRPEQPIGAEPAASMQAQSPLGSLVVTLDTTTMRTVDALHVTIRLDRPPEVVPGSLDFAPVDEGWTVTAAAPPETWVQADGNLATRWSYTLEPFLEGAYQVPSASIALKQLDGDQTRLVTSALEVEVRSVFALGEEQVLAKPRPIEKPGPPADHRPWWFVGAVVGGIVIIGGAVFMTWRLRPVASTMAEASASLDAREQVGVVRGRLIADLVEQAGLNDHAWATDELELALCAKRQGHFKAALDLLKQLDASLYGRDEPSPEIVNSYEKQIKVLRERYRAVASVDGGAA